MQIGLVAGMGIVYLLAIIRIYMHNNDLGGHIALMRRALLCCSVVILGAMVMMEARTSSLAEPDAVVGAVTMGWTRSVVGAWGGHLATGWPATAAHELRERRQDDLALAAKASQHGATMQEDNSR